MFGVELFAEENVNRTSRNFAKRLNFVRAVMIVNSFLMLWLVQALAARGKSRAKSSGRRFGRNRGAKSKGMWGIFEISQRRVRAKRPRAVRVEFYHGLLSLFFEASLHFPTGVAKQESGRLDARPHSVKG